MNLFEFLMICHMLLDRFAQLLIFFASHLSGCRHPDEERPTLGIFITSQIFFYFNNMRAEIFMMHGYSCKCDYDLLLVGEYCDRQLQMHGRPPPIAHRRRTLRSSADYRITSHGVDGRKPEGLYIRRIHCNTFN